MKRYFYLCHYFADRESYVDTYMAAEQVELDTWLRSCCEHWSYAIHEAVIPGVFVAFTDDAEAVAFAFRFPDRETSCHWGEAIEKAREVRKGCSLRDGGADEADLTGANPASDGVVQ